jgi:RNA polymerase sigma factor (sigma-70 family)
MPIRPLHSLVHQVLQRATNTGGGGTSDGALLERFVGGQDHTAFETLVWRHGPMVMGTCRRILRNNHDAEDAFQATFLLLFRKAGSVRRQGSLGSWLFKVAYRVALRAQAWTSAQRKEGQALIDPPAPDYADDLAGRELRPVLDQQLQRLPEKYRAPLVLHYLEGKTVEQVAQELGCPSGTVSVRLDRGKQMLRKRLPQGLALSTAALATMLGQTASAEAPAGLVAATLHAAMSCAAGKTASAPVNALIEGVLRTMFLSKLKLAAAAVLATCLLMAGAGFLAQQAGLLRAAEQAAESPLPASVSDQPTPKAAPPRLDLHGAALPPGALARLGDARFRQGSGVASLAFSPDGETLASCGDDGTIRLWEAATGMEIRTWTGEGSPVWFLADGKTLASSGRKLLEIVLWEAATGKKIRTLTGIDVLSADGKFLASRSKLSSLWEVATDKQIHTLVGSPRGVAFSLDGETLATISDKGRMVVWEAATGKEISTWTPPQGRTPGPIGFSADGKILATVRNGVITPGEVMLWEAATAKRILTVTGDWFALSSNGKTLATWGKHDDPIWLWDVATGKKIHTLTGHLGHWIYSAAFSPDGKTLASGGDDGTIRRWEVATGKEIALSGHQREVRAVTFSPDGKTLASGSADKTIRLWEPDTGKEIRTLTGHLQGVNSVAFSPDGKTLASGGEDERTTLGGDDKTIRLWEAATGKVSRILPGLRGFVFSVGFSPDGKTLASGNGDRTIGLWEAATGKEIRTLKESYGAVAFSPDGKTLASGGNRSLTTEVSLWAVATGQKIRTLDHKVVLAVAFSPDGKVLASGSVDKTIHVVEVITGKEIRTLSGHQGAVSSVAFSPDGETLASASDDKTVRLWDVATGKEIRVFAGHRGPVRSVAYAPDGKTLASASVDTTVLVWDLANAGK